MGILDTLKGTVTKDGLKTALDVAGTLAGNILGSGGFSSAQGVSTTKSKILMRYQQQLAREQFQWQNENQYGFMRKGLEDAGYNPLLALGASPSTGDVGAVAAQGNTASSQFGLNDWASIMNTVAQTKNIESNTDATELGVLSKFLGTKFGKQVEGAIRKTISSISNSAKDDSGVGLLKGYVSNSPDDGLDHYYDKHTDYINSQPLPDSLRRSRGF